MIHFLLLNNLHLLSVKKENPNSFISAASQKMWQNTGHVPFVMPQRALITSLTVESQALTTAAAEAGDRGFIWEAVNTGLKVLLSAKLSEWDEKD